MAPIVSATRECVLHGEDEGLVGVLDGGASQGDQAPGWLWRQILRESWGCSQRRLRCCAEGTDARVL